MIRYKDSIEKLLANVDEIDEEIISLSSAIGRITSRDIFCPHDLPLFDNSAMDGFAFAKSQSKDATVDKPKLIPIKGIIAAGDQLQSRDNLKAAYEIMTGAVMPANCDTVIMKEHANIIAHEDIKHLMLSEHIHFTENVRKRGEDFQTGECVIQKGNKITAAHIMVLASFGIIELKVFRKPEIAIISTGSELVAAYAENLQLGQVRQSNNIYLKNFLTQLGTEIISSYAIPDDPHILQQEIKRLLNASPQPDLIVTTGAVSAGKWDFIPEMFTKMQGEIFFHKVAIKPGKPVLCGRITNKTLFIGLPGNPVSSVCGARFFINPVLRKMFGMPKEKYFHAKLKHDINKKNNLLIFNKAYVKTNELGEVEVDILAGQESFKMKPLLNANSWALLCEDRKDFKANDIISCYHLIPSD